MGIETPYENWTRFPNCILDSLEKFTGNEIKILCLMVRKNIGHDEPTKQFSISYVSKKTGLAKQTVITAIQELVKKQAIHELESGERGLKRYEILWTESKRHVQKLDMSKKWTSPKIRQEPVQKLDKNLSKKWTQYKNPIVQEPYGQDPKAEESPSGIQNEGSFCQSKSKPEPAPDIPEWVSRETWDEYLKIRASMKTPNTARALSMILKRLSEFREHGHDPNAVLENSIMNGWKGVFEPKTNGKGKGQFANHPAVKSGMLSENAAITAENIRKLIEKGELNL